MRRVTWGERCYLVPWDDGTLLVGATVEEAGFDERATVAGVHGSARRGVRARAASLESAGFSARASACGPRRPTACRSSVGRARCRTLMYATGHYRNGMLLAPLTATARRRRVLENRVDPMLAAARPPKIRCAVIPRIICQERDGQWVAPARRDDNGDPFGIECVAATRDEALGRLNRWLDWQREHAAALEALQQAERAYHRTLAGARLREPRTRGRRSGELQKESLEAVEAARVRLDEVRARKPE